MKSQHGPSRRAQGLPPWRARPRSARPRPARPRSQAVSHGPFGCREGTCIAILAGHGRRRHRLRGGLLWCGAWTESSLRLLGRPCRGVTATTAGTTTTRGDHPWRPACSQLPPWSQQPAAMATSVRHSGTTMRHNSRQHNEKLCHCKVSQCTTAHVNTR